MQRDKKNVYQLSAGVIRKTIKQFLKIPTNVASYEKAKEFAEKAIQEEMSEWKFLIPTFGRWLICSLLQKER